MQRSESRPAGIVAQAMSVFLAALAMLLTAHPAAATPMTYTVTNTQCVGAGSITQAMDLANANPGEDTITFESGLVVDYRTCPPNDAPADPGDYFTLQATESVIFEGNNAMLSGEMVWIDDNGINQAGRRCSIPTDVITALTPGFIKVGFLGDDNSAIDNSAITVTVRNLEIKGLSAVAQIERAASLVIEDSKITEIYAAPNGGCLQSAVLAKSEANFSSHRTEWFDIWNGAKALLGVALNGAIGADEGGNLTVEDSSFGRIRDAGVIDWSGQAGSEVNIVTSRFDDAGGISVSGAASSNIVNSIWSDDGVQPRLYDRIINNSSEEMNIVASTLLFASVECDFLCQEEAGSRGRVFRQLDGAKINLIQSAIGVTFPDIGDTQTKLLDPNGFDDDPPPFSFSADGDTWIQPTALQDAYALELVTEQPALLTDPPGLPTFPPLALGQVARATPLISGLLIDRIADAACTQTNALINPIDSTCITEDALGNERWDGNDKRNTGAVQLNEAPHLSVIGVGDGTVDLSWTKPRDLTGLTGYVLFYRKTQGAFKEVEVTGPDTLTYKFTGLTNGVEYEFLVDSVVDGVLGEFPSNRVTATPQASAGTNPPSYSRPATNRENKPRYWENLGFGDCTKFEVGDDFGPTWEVMPDEYPSALILKSARVNDVWVSPNPGYYDTLSGKDISHAIVCFGNP